MLEIQEQHCFLRVGFLIAIRLKQFWGPGFTAVIRWELVSTFLTYDRLTAAVTRHLRPCHLFKHSGFQTTCSVKDAKRFMY